MLRIPIFRKLMMLMPGLAAALVLDRVGDLRDVGDDDGTAIGQVRG